MPVSFAWCVFLFRYLFLVVMVPRGKVGFELVFSFFFFCGPLKVIERPLVQCNVV